MSKRIALDIILFLGTFIAPPWLVILLATIGLLSFENFYEILPIGFIIDALYGVPTPPLLIPIFYTTISSCLFIVMIFSRKHLRFYR